MHMHVKRVACAREAGIVRTPWLADLSFISYKLHFLSTFSLKIGSTVLFTHLKIILLQCFQFSIFSFQFQLNKFYSNRPNKKKCSKFFVLYEFKVESLSIDIPH